jgi:peroxiredoxin/cytochrome c553
MPWRFVAVSFLVAGAVASLWLTRPLPAGDPITKNLGKKIANIAFTAADGKTTQLYDIKDKKAIVLVFLSFDCPVSTSYLQPLADLAHEFGPRGIAFVGLTTNQDETPADVALHIKEFNVPFPVVLDKQLAGADAVTAERTPEVFVLDASYVLRYRGRIDDAYYARLKRNQKVSRHDLRLALDEILSGRPVSVAVTEAIGCHILRPLAVAAKVSKVTYHKDVLPILQKNCQECHRPDGAAPFALMNFRQAVNWAADIKAYTQSRRMPPWKIDAGLPFQNERRLSDREIAVLADWADSGTPEGNNQDAPAPGKFAKGWRLGKPDLVLTLSEDFQIGPTGNDVFRCFVLPTNLTEDKFVQALEVKPGNPRLVHHALLFIDTAGKGRALEQLQLKVLFKDPQGGNPLDKGSGYFGGMGVGFLPAGNLGGWAPGQLPRTLPEGIGVSLPKGSDVIIQMHYHRNGRLEKDKTAIGLYYSKQKVIRPYQVEVLIGLFEAIPAGNEHFVVKGTSYVTEDMILYDLLPHMHMVGKEIKVTMTPPDGQPTLLFHIKDWDFNWQETYIFEEPLQVKAGTRLDLEAVYDNSAKNPNNPFQPPRTVIYGEQTFNEMCSVYLGGTSVRKDGWLPLSDLAEKKKQ